jgi:hypothetical protein
VTRARDPLLPPRNASRGKRRKRRGAQVADRRALGDIETREKGGLTGRGGPVVKAGLGGWRFRPNRELEVFLFPYTHEYNSNINLN